MCLEQVCYQSPLLLIPLHAYAIREGHQPCITGCTAAVQELDALLQEINRELEAAGHEVLKLHAGLCQGCWVGSK